MLSKRFLAPIKLVKDIFSIIKFHQIKLLFQWEWKGGIKEENSPSSFDIFKSFNIICLKLFYPRVKSEVSGGELGPINCNVPYTNSVYAPDCLSQWFCPGAEPTW